MDIETKQMFELILNKLDNIEKRQDNMERNQEDLKRNQISMEKRQEKMEERQVNMERRQDEIFQVVKAIEHSNNVHKSEIDNIQYKVANTEGIINKIGNIINDNKAVV